MAGVFYYEKNNVAAPPVLTSTTNSTGPQAGGQTAAGASTDQVVAINASNLVNVTFTLKWTATQGKDTMKLAVAPSNGTGVTEGAVSSPSDAGILAVTVRVPQNATGGELGRGDWKVTVTFV